MRHSRLWCVLLVLKVNEILERGNECVIISLDAALPGAFDRVWHAGLVKKLRAAGTRGSQTDQVLPQEPTHFSGC